MLAVEFLNAAAWLHHELTLFATVGILLTGIGDVVLDIFWLARLGWRRFAIYGRYQRAEAETLPLPRHTGRIAFVVPAWDEGAVIEPMLRHACNALGEAKWRLFVGIYPNDAITLAAVRAVSNDRIEVVTNNRDGPTTKADCLNAIWRALLADERLNGPFKAVVLHDAEDVIHASEFRVFDSLIERFDFVQLPVVPLVDRRSQFVGGHYIDEFAEHHGKTMVIREAIGAALPSAGVGCAFSRDILARIAATGGDMPFDDGSLTEDYELGLRVAELGGRGAFVRINNADGDLVAVRAHFPRTFEAAIKQKARWVVGIALSGWDRLGWHGGLSERWMRMRDRRALISAVVLLAAYLSSLLTLAMLVVGWLFHVDIFAPITPLLWWLIRGATVLLIWRLVFRALFVSRFYGPIQGLLSIPRAIIANVIAMLAARRAVGLYLEARRKGVVRWEKTDHSFPEHLKQGL